MRETIDKLDEIVRQFITYDRTVFDYLPNKEKVNLSGENELVIRKDDDIYVWQCRLNQREYSLFTFIDKKLYSIEILTLFDVDEIEFQLYVGDKKYLINCDWFDKIDFEAQAFQIDTTNRFDFSLLTVNSILKNLGA